MHLRTLRIRGFKSFPEPLEIALEPGVAVVVGPNGSGKSNIADAVVWAAGSLTPSELRAEKPDDVLFAGGEDRKAADHCEVELVFDNEDGSFADLDFSEVSIARRLVRGAEGQYLVNKAPVRRTDLVELLSDVGLGAAMHSIVGQGKVEQVLASKPEDRRALVEEAAGLGKFKRRRHRAELKLARVALQVERAKDVEEEVRKRLRPLALQATAAERADKLAIEIASLQARVAELDLEDAGRRRSEIEGRRDDAALARRGSQSRLEGLLADRTRAEDELSDAAGRREAAVAALYRLQGGSERLALRSETAARCETGLRRSSARSSRPRRARRTAGVPSSARPPSARPLRATLPRSGIASASRHGLPRSGCARSSAFSRSRRASRRLLVRWPSGERDWRSGRSRSSQDRSGQWLPPFGHARLPFSRRALVPGSSCSSALARRAWEASSSSPGLEPQELVREFPVVPKEELLGASVPSVTREGFGYDPARRELWFAGETAEAVLLELEARRREIEAEVVDLERRALEAVHVADETAKRAEASAAALGGLPARPVAPAIDRELLVGIHARARAPRERARSRSDGGRALRRAAPCARRRRCAESG